MSRWSDIEAKQKKNSRWEEISNENSYESRYNKIVNDYNNYVKSDRNFDIDAFVPKQDSTTRFQNSAYNASQGYKNIDNLTRGIENSSMSDDQKKNYLNGLKTIRNNYAQYLDYDKQLNDFWSQFEDEDTYNLWKKTAYKYKDSDLSTHEAIEKLKSETKDSDVLDWLEGKNLDLYSERELVNLEQEALDRFDDAAAAKYHAANTYRKAEKIKNANITIDGKQVSGFDLLKMANERESELQQLTLAANDKTAVNSPEYQRLLVKKEEAAAKVEEMKQIFAENGLTYPQKKSVWEALKKYADKGANNFNYGWSATLNLILGNPLSSLGWTDNPFTVTRNFYKGKFDYDSILAQEYAKQADLPEIVGELVSGTVADLPDAVMGIMTGGFSKAATAAGLAATAAKNTSSILGKAGLTVQAMAKNPFYWTSFVREVGSDYEEAVENGANETVATYAALLTGAINAGIEIGTDGMSGIQGLPQELLSGNKSVIASWAESMLEEGKEEVLQGIVQNLVAKVSYDHDKPLVGVNGEAVIDPYRALEEFGMGAAVGGILGGGQILGTAALSGGINALGNSELRKYGENIRKTEGAAEQLIQFAQAHPEYKATANILSKINTDNVSDVQLGKVYASVWSDVENTVKSLKSDSEKAQYLEALYINNRNSPIIASAAVGIATNLDNQKAERTKAASKKYAEKSQAVRNAVFSEKATDNDIKNILLDNDTIEEFEDITGKKIQGKTTAEQESIVRDFLETRDIARLPYKENANIAVRNFDTGEDVVIRGIKKKSNSEVIFETSAGDMSYGDISMPSSLATVIKDATSKYGIDTANSFLRHLTDTDMNPAQYAANFSAIYNIGRATDTSFEEVSKEFPSAVKNMGESAARAAFNRGRADIVKQKQETPNVTTETRGRYTNESDSEAPFSPEVYESVAKKTGIDIHRIEEESPVRGHFNVNMLSMLINADNSNEFSTLVHELGEYGEVLNYEGMKQVQDNVIKWYLKQNENGISLDNYIKQYQAAYEQKTKSSVSYEEAVKEITNDAIAGLFNTDGGIKQFVTWVHSESGLSVSEQKTLLQKIKDILNAIALKLREWVKGKDFTGSESMLLEMEANEAAKLRSQFLKAIDEATANLQTIKNTDTENVSADVEYSLSVNAATEIEKALNDKYYNSEIQLTDNTPNIMLDQKGVKNLPLVMKASHIRENVFTETEAKKKGLKTNKGINYHGLGKVLFLNTISDLDNVKEAYRGTKKASNPARGENYFLLISQQTDAAGNIVNVPVYINQHGLVNNVIMDVNQVATVFGRSNFRKYITEKVNSGELVRIKRRNIQSGDSTAPIAAQYGKNVSSDNAIITEKNSVVNRDYMQNEKNNSKGENKYSFDVGGHRGKGYDGYSMSNNARAAYESGERPLSRWNKTLVIEEIAKENGVSPEDISLKMPYQYYLEKTSWHHTSSKYNKTDFYSLVYNDEDVSFSQKAIEKINNDKETEIKLRLEYAEKRLAKLNEWNPSATEDETFIYSTDENGIKHKFRKKYTTKETVLSNMKERVENAKQSEQKSIETLKERLKNSDKDNTRFSLKLPVEETKDLIAVHNLTQEDLLKTLKLGGFPMPSVAIVKAQNGHNEFGDVSVIFDKNTIDPSKSGNKVYGGDAWTPSFPTIEYKPRESVQQKISDKYYDLAKRIGYDNAKPLYNYVYDMERKLAAGEDVLLTTLYSDTDMMNLYRQDIGEKKIDTVKKTVETKMSDADIERSQFILEKLPDLISELDNATGSPFIKAKNLVDNNLEKIQNVFRELYKQYGFSNEQIENAINGTTKSDYVNFIRDARKYRANNGVTVREETDTPATKEKIIAETDQNAYKKWVNGLFKGIEEKKGLRNNKDPYTPSGNARSFEALHYEVNLENVVRAMKEESPIGNSFFSFSGIWGAAAKQYNSISEIKEDSSRLKTITQEEFDTIREGFGERLNEIAASIIDTGISNPLIALDTAMSQIVDAINTSRTKSGMLRALQQYNPKATEMTVQDIIDLVNDISNMPTEYFEAKPRRAVGLDEIRAILIPSNASEDLKTALSDYNTVEYEAGNTEDRISKLNSLNDLKFSLAVDNVSDSRADIVSNEKYQKLVEDLKRKYQYAKEEVQKTKGKKIDRVAVKSTIKDIARFYNSKIDVETFTDRLTDIYNRMAKDKNLTPDSYKYEIEALARDIIDESKRFTEVSEHSKNILRDIRVNAIYFSKADQQEAAYIADSFKNYRNNLMGSVIIATKDTYAMDVNSWAEQMISKYPELRMFFPDGTITSGDVVAALPDIIDSLRNTYQADMEGLDYESEVEMTTLELLDGFAEMPRRQTFADKKESELKQRIKEVRAEEKEKFEKRVEKVIEKERAAKKESKQKVYDKKNEQLARQKAFYQERAKRNAEARRESDERKRLVPRIYKTVKKMAEMLNKPTNNAHIPEVLRTTVGGVLSQIELLENGRDYSTLSVRDKTLYTELEKMKSKIASIEKAQMGKEDKDGNIDYDNSDFELDLPDGFSNEVDNLAKRVQAYIQQDEHFTLHTMSNEDLANLDYILTIMKHSVSQINRMYKNARYSHIEELGNTTINDITSYGNQKKFTDSTVGGFFTWKNATPVYAFERFGEAGNSVFKEIANGWSKLARNAQSVIDFSEKTWTPKEYNAWKEEVHEVRLHDGKTIKMNTPQIMSLYLLNQREQARKHIYGGGVVFIDGGKGKNAVTTNMTIDDVVKITSKLSKRQIEVANAIQNQMSTVGSDWGNEISMTRFGYKFFTEPHYFPISVDENSRNILQSNSMKSTDIFRLLNMGATKGVNEKANAPIDIFDAFDVFADHMSDMAKYNALALPILDTIKWINYKTRIPLPEGGFKMKSVREAMDTAYGKDAQKYVIRFLKDLNGVKEGGSDVDSFAGRVFSNVKVAKVGANLRVALLQPTSYVRAGYVLSAKSLAMGINAAVRDGKKLYQEALNKSGLALWKDQGFYDTNINRSMRSMIKNDAGIIDTIKEKSMILAEAGDKATWTALWGACRWEVLHQNPDIKLNSQEFYTKVTDLFDETILKTQVMDSTITRSELMRDSSFAAKTITAFGSESAVSYNMLMNGLSEFSRLKGQGASKKVLIGSLNVAGRGLLYYVLNNAISAVVESFFDWERDEDKDEKFSETWWENFALNNSILLKIPFVKEIVGPLYANTVGIGYSSTSETGAEIGDDVMAVARAVQKIYKTVTSGKEEITPYGVAYILGNLASDVTGIPITPAMREAVSAYNTAVSSMGKDEWIIRKSPVTASTRVRNAVNKGYDYFASHIKDIIEYKKTEMYYNLLGKDFTEDYARRNSTDEDAKKSIRATLTNIFKAEYVTASSSRRSEIERMMRASGVYDDVSKTVNDWLNKYAETEKYKR